MSPVDDPIEPAKVPTTQAAIKAQQQRIDYLFRQVPEDPGAQYLKTLIESLQNGVAT